jgi:hypothetical protein
VERIYKLTETSSDIHHYYNILLSVEEVAEDEIVVDNVDVDEADVVELVTEAFV